MKTCGVIGALAFMTSGISACHDAGDPPTAPTAPAASSVAAPPVPSASVPTPTSSEKTPESCAAIVAAKPDFANCKWSVDKRACVCNGCQADADCSAKSGGTCTPLPSTKSIMPAAKVCLYPGDDCFAGATCAKGSCNHNGMGKSSGCATQGDFRK